MNTTEEFLAKTINITAGLEALSKRLSVLEDAAGNPRRAEAEAVESGEDLLKRASDLRGEVEKLCKLS